MGFTSGFAGGVTLTLSIAYLSAVAHQRNREQQAQILRTQALAIQSLIDPIPAPLPPTRSEVAAAQRATAVEVAKDRWNQEVLNAVRWAQHTDWDEVREGLEESVAGVWAKIFGESAEESAERAKEKKLDPAVQKTKSKMQETTSNVAAAARGAFEKAKEKEAQLEMSAEDKALDARLNAKKGVEKAEGIAQEAATETKGVFAAALERGKEFVDSAKAAVGVAEKKVAATLDGKPVDTMNPVEKALQQRYEKPQPTQKRTVADVLKERYMPIDQRDNTILRGL